MTSAGSREDAAGVVQLGANASRELIEEAYWHLVARAKELAVHLRDARIAELGQAYQLLCASPPTAAATRPPAPRIGHRSVLTPRDCHRLLDVHPDADETVIRLALATHLRRLGHTRADDEARAELQRASIVLLSRTAEMHAIPAEAEERIAQLDQRMVAGGRQQAAPVIEFPLRERSQISRMPLAAAEPQLARALSASVVMTGAQKVIAVLLLALLAVGLGVATLYTLIGLITVATIIYLVAMGYKAVLVLRSLSAPCETLVSDEDIAALDGQELPIYTVLVPLYHEGNVLEHLITALDQLDYPKHRLDVKLLLEEDDVETRAVAERLELPPYIELTIVPATSEPKGKPRACNHGLRSAQGDYVVLYDAEDVPEPLQLKKALLAFRQSGDEVGCVQAKLNYFNPGQNLLTRWFTIEYSTWFDLYLPGLNSVAAPIPLGGTSNHFRVDVLRAAGAWDAFNVTEDADLGVRLARLGFRTLLIDSWTLEEANSRVGNWLRQRSRWIKGYMQTWLVHMRDPAGLYRDLGGWGFLAFQVMILGTFFVYFANPVFWLLVATWYATHSSSIQALYPAPVLYLATLSLFAGNFFFIVVGISASLKRGYFEGVKYVLGSYFYWALMSVAAWKALFQLIFRPHYWEKTQHGLNAARAVTVKGAGSE